nr:hypothetical protein [uncultured Bacteroides sp.]
MDSFIKKINVIALCAFLYTPMYLYNKQINVMLVVVSFAIWIISSFRIDSDWIKRFKPYIPTLIMMIGINVLYCNCTGTDLYTTMVMSILAYTGILLYAFYSNHIDLLKWPFIFLIIILCLDCVDTIKGNMMIPGISRKQGDGFDTQEASYILNSMHIGSYPFLYSIALLILPITLFFKHKVIRKYLYFPITILSVVTILYGSYFISLIITLLMIFFGIMDIRNLKKTVVLCIISAVIFTIAKDPIMDGLVYMGEKTGSSVLVSHAIEIKNSGAVDGANQFTGGRSSLYMNAVLNFLEHPLIGQMDGEKSSHFSMHSELLEYPEKYGLLSIPFFYIWLLLFKTQHGVLRTKQIKSYHTIFFATLIVFLFINPLRCEQPFSLTAYCIIPLMLLFLDMKIDN